MELTEADAGAEHTLPVGEDLAVRLPENRTTGYRWHLAVPDEGLEVADDSYQAPDAARPGSGGTRTVRLRPTGPGTHHLVAELRRPWEAEGAGRRVEYTITTR